MAKKTPQVQSKKLVPNIEKKAQPIQNEVLNRGFSLINWTQTIKIYLIFVTSLYILSIFFKLHTSSIPIWNQVANDGGSQKRGLLLGKPQSIRSDEWLVSTSFILSQINHNFPIENISLGYGKVPMVMGLPNKSLITLFKPTHWGYFVLDAERAFSLDWNFKYFGCFTLLFLFFLLITKNNFWISLGASFLTIFSSMVYWWSINIELLNWGSLIFISLAYIFFHKNNLVKILSGIFLTIGLINFALYLYIPFEIPMMYFWAFAFTGYFLSNYKEGNAFSLLPIKLTIITASLGLVGFCLIYFMAEIKETFEVISNTVYPGKRSVVGGDYPVNRLFTDMYSLFVTSEKFPPIWGNICELSGYLFIAPFVLPVIGYSFITNKKINYLLLTTGIYVIIGIVWATIGFPEILAKLTLMNMSPAFRSVYALGFGGIVLIVLYVTSEISTKPFNKPIIMLAVWAAAFLISIIIANSLNTSANNYFKQNQVYIAAFLFSLIIFCLIYSTTSKYFQIALGLILLIYLFPNTKIHPLSQGFKPYYDNAIYKSTKEIVAKDPNAGWVVFGQFTFSNYLKAAGANVFSGVQWAPNFKKIKILDPSSKYDSVYNRYAHVSYYPMINGSDSVAFTLIQNDAYAIQMDPSSPRLKEMGFKYVFFTYQPQAAETRGLKKYEGSNLPVYYFE